jgi:hypothetical protein
MNRGTNSFHEALHVDLAPSAARGYRLALGTVYAVHRPLSRVVCQLTAKSSRRRRLLMRGGVLRVLRCAAAPRRITTITLRTQRLDAAVSWPLVDLPRWKVQQDQQALDTPVQTV